MNRVKRGEDLRILINKGVTFTSLNYIKDLVMPPNIKHCFDGFEQHEKYTSRWYKDLTYESFVKNTKEKIKFTKY